MATSDEPQSPGSLVPAALSDRLDYVLCRVAAEVKRLGDDALAAVGLRVAHHALLRLLAVEGELRQQDIAERAGVDKSTVVDQVKALLELGLITRVRSADDGRVNLIALTDQGATKLAEGDRVVADMQAGLFPSLSSTERTQLHALLAALAVGLRPGT